VKRPEVISGCPDLSEPLTRRQHNDDVTDSTAGHPGAPCSGVPSSSVNIRVPSSSVNIRVPSSSVNIIFLAEQQ
ncbi:hypothetical protein KUCAC02_011712, partial [Chaenocephalus aceratus]